ncbi:MAG: hypothetical protein ACTTK1_06715, partial [Candidatus Cryptobacteroides sp.]
KAKAPTSKPGQDNFDFLSENLGACYDGDLETYPESNVWVKISNGRKTEVIKITRFCSISASKYNHTFYQWGRKDPMLPSDGTTSNKNKVWYDKSGVQSYFLPNAYWPSNGSASQANAEIANTIKNPRMYNYAYSMDGRYYNLWDSSCNETGGYNNITTARFLPVTKSVYDPCPPGFCLPPNGAFTGFTESGNNSSNSSELNVSGSFNKGWHFRTVLKGESGSETIFFPVSGDRGGNGSLFTVGLLGLYWSSVPHTMTAGCYLYLSSGYVHPLYVKFCVGGYALRPVKE